jgi:uncharacterized membrane protein YfcA
MTLFGVHGTEAVSAVFLIAAAPFALLVWFRDRLHPDTYVVAGTIYGVLALIGTVFGFIVYAQRSDAGDTTISGVGIIVLIYYLYRLWKNWKNRKKTLAALGAKSKALRDTLVRRMRQAQPEGSR